MKNIKIALILLCIVNWQLNADTLTDNLELLKNSLHELLTSLGEEPIPKAEVHTTHSGKERTYSINGFTIHVIHTSLLNIKNVDAIVNAANPKMAHGGGLSSAIFNAASPPRGKKLSDYISMNFPKGINFGEAAIIPAFDLTKSNNVQYIIFAVGANFNLKGATPNQLKNAYHNSLLLANTNRLSSIAFPPLSASIYRGPKSIYEIAQTGFDGIMRYIKNPPHDNSLKTIIIACFKHNEFDAFINAIDQYFQA